MRNDKIMQNWGKIYDCVMYVCRDIEFMMSNYKLWANEETRKKIECDLVGADAWDIQVAPICEDVEIYITDQVVETYKADIGERRYLVNALWREYMPEELHDDIIRMGAMVRLKQMQLENAAHPLANCVVGSIDLDLMEIL